jgi:hypothetical protein
MTMFGNGLCRDGQNQLNPRIIKDRLNPFLHQGGQSCRLREDSELALGKSREAGIRPTEIQYSRTERSDREEFGDRVPGNERTDPA